MEDTMKITRKVMFIVLVIAGGWSCAQTYYTKSFRLSTEDPKDAISSFDRLIDGPLGEFHHSQMFLRMVALYESNNVAKMNQQNFDILLEQRLPKGQSDTVAVDSLVLTMRPSGERRVLPRRRLLVYNGDSMPEPRIRSTFGSIEILPGTDTVLVSFVARGGKSDVTGEVREFSLTMIRFEGAMSKVGVQPKDKL
jgi:hypothetical protein